MWTDETTTSSLIFSVVNDPVAQRLLYQAQLHHENFRNSSQQLHEAFRQLLFRDFARVNSCHMTEGVFGADIHAAEMESAKVRVWGFLLNTATAGHKMLRCIVNARNKDRASDWRSLSDSLATPFDTYRRLRNFLEHLDEKVNLEEVTDIKDCRFHRNGYLEFSDKRGQLHWDFTEEGLVPLKATWQRVIDMLRERENVAENSLPPSSTKDASRSRAGVE